MAFDTIAILIRRCVDMVEQLALVSTTTDRTYERIKPEYPDGFWAWLDKNEHVYQAFVRLAIRGQKKGLRHWSARAIIHVLRWQTAMEDSDELFKINNSYTPGLARLAMQEYPLLNDFFLIRERT